MMSTLEKRNQSEEPNGAGGNGPSKRARTIVGTATMTVIWSSYTSHFSNYCKGRKKVVQKVPGKVWLAVWDDFVAFKKQEASSNGIDFREDELPAQRTLQDALRSALDQQQTGTSDEQGRHASLQNEDALQRLKRSDMYSKLKMGELRDKLATSDIPNGDGKRDGSSNGQPSSSGRATKKDLMLRNSEAMERMVDAIDSGTASVTQAMADQAKILQEGLDVKLADFNRKKAKDAEEVLDMKLKRLILLRDNGVLSDEDFKRRASELVSL